MWIMDALWGQQLYLGADCIRNGANPDGSVSHIMGVLEDISARKQTELHLKQAMEKSEAANQAKGHFIAMVSHEIRTPLNAIIGLSSFLLNRNGCRAAQFD